MAKIAGVVIVYYPDFNKLFINIKTYIDNVEHLYVVFNSPVRKEDANILCSEFSNIQLIINDENVGIASALNQAAQKALSLGYEWLLTMDQDSSFHSDSYFKAFEKSENKSIAIISPNPEIDTISNVGDTDTTDEILCAITSGNLLNLKIWKTIGGFEEKLFIDEVDNEYCLRAILNGFKIIRFKNIPLIHKLGQNKTVSLFFRKYTIIIHPPLRNYYIFRNSLYIFSKYKKEFPDFVRSRKIVLLKVFIKILLFSSEKFKNCRYIFNGVKDYFNNSFGCYKGEITKSKKS